MSFTLLVVSFIFVYLREVRLLIKSSNLSQVSRRNSSESHQPFNTCFIEFHEFICNGLCVIYEVGETHPT